MSRTSGMLSIKFSAKDGFGYTITTESDNSASENVLPQVFHDCKTITVNLITAYGKRQMH